LQGRDVVLVGGLSNPTELFFEGRDGKELRPEHRFPFRQNVVAAVVNKAMNEVTRKMVEDVFLRAQHRKRILQKEEGFTGGNIKFMKMDGRGGKHCSNVHVKPFLLTRKKFARVERVKETVQTGIAADFLFGHDEMTVWLLFEPNEDFFAGTGGTDFPVSGLL
jgi:hypothetical protein